MNDFNEADARNGYAPSKKMLVGATAAAAVAYVSNVTICLCCGALLSSYANNVTSYNYLS